MLDEYASQASQIGAGFFSCRLLTSISALRADQVVERHGAALAPFTQAVHGRSAQAERPSLPPRQSPPRLCWPISRVDQPSAGGSHVPSHRHAGHRRRGLRRHLERDRSRAPPRRPCRGLERDGDLPRSGDGGRRAGRDRCHAGGRAGEVPGLRARAHLEGRHAWRPRGTLSALHLVAGSGRRALGRRGRRFLHPGAGRAARVRGRLHRQDAGVRRHAGVAVRRRTAIPRPVRCVILKIGMAGDRATPTRARLDAVSASTPRRVGKKALHTK